MVTSYRLKRSDPLPRVVLGKAYNLIAKTIFGLKVRDIDCDFRLIRRSVFEKVKLTRDSGVICIELMKKISQNGFEIREVCVHHFNRQFGNSQFFRINQILRLGIDMIGLWAELMILTGKT